MRKPARSAKPTQLASRHSAPGADVAAHCGKCRKTTKHRVLAKVGGKPTRVECRLCHGKHPYRPPAAAAGRTGAPAKPAKAVPTPRATPAVTAKGAPTKPGSAEKPTPAKTPSPAKTPKIGKLTVAPPPVARAAAPSKGQRAPRLAAAGSSSKRAAGSAAAAPRPEEAWARAMRGASGPAIPYATSERYEVGQRLKHPTFGDGVVTRLSSPTVCEVAFPDGLRKLLMAS